MKKDAAVKDELAIQWVIRSGPYLTILARYPLPCRCGKCFFASSVLLGMN
jgi:hypothetical protein